MPLTVEFKNIKVNECYQYFDRGINGAVVQTKVDETWGNVVSLGDVFSITQAIQTKYRALQDLLNIYGGTVPEKDRINVLLAEIDALKAKVNANGGLSQTDKDALLAKITAANTETTCFLATNCTKTSAETKIAEVLDLARRNGKLPPPGDTPPAAAASFTNPNARSTTANPCYDGLLPFETYSGGSVLELAKMNTCFSKDIKFEKNNVKVCGTAIPGLQYNGTWDNDEDNRYYSLVTPTETYYVYRTIVLSCRRYYAAKKSYWTNPAGCNLGAGNCQDLWTRVNIPYGTSPGEDAAEGIAQTFAYSLAAGAAIATTSISTLTVAAKQALIVTKGDVAIIFAITAFTCSDCTPEQFIESFALNLAGNQAFKGAFAGASQSEILAAARVYAARYVEYLKNTGVFKRSTSEISEFGSKVSSKWQSLLDKLKSKVGVVQQAGRLAWKEGETFMTTVQNSRIGSWMSKIEYDLMVSTSQLQKRSGGLTHVLLEGKQHYTDIGGKIYVEFDIPANTTISRGSGTGWGIFYEEGSTRWKFFNSKGLNVAQPKVSNIQIVDRNGL
jgi:hypothetical protein